MLRTEAVLWDLDGVLVDSSALYWEALVEVFEEYGLSVSWERYIANFGRTTEASIAAHLLHRADPELVKKVSVTWDNRYREKVPGKINLLPGAQHWLELFSARGYPQAIASSSPLETILAVVKETGITHYFRALVSAANRLPSKPDPAVFLEAAQKVEKPPLACLVIEDSPAGLEAANRGGMKSIGVCTSHPPEKLAHASLVIPSLDMLDPELLQALLEKSG